jgi:magnesium transporter
VFFTSATIVSGAVLFRGFKGTTIEIITVVLGFLQICSGVVLLQLSKSAKDVPDTAVFSGDLDQVRTVAEQEEPEYEPRADTMRGTAALLRAISTRRQKRETQEIQRIRDEHMEPIGEHDPVEWDGLRRRRTLSSPATPNLQRRKTIHPPLGMSHFPTEDEDNDPDNGMHPGFWSHFKRKPVSTGSEAEVSSMPMDNLKQGNTGPDGRVVTPPNPKSPTRSGHIFGIPSPLRRVRPSGGDSTDGYFEQDTSYHGANTASPNDGHVHFVSTSAPHLAGRPRDDSLGSGGASPPLASRSAVGLPHSPRDSRDGTRRQFSFQNVFHRNRSPSSNQPSPGDSSPRALMNRSALSFTRRTPSAASARAQGAVGTEEEQLGLVRGDTTELLPGYESRRGSLVDNGAGNSPPRYDGGTVIRRPRRDDEDDEEEDRRRDAEAKEFEGTGTHGRSFI